MGNVRAFARVLDGHSADLTVAIQIQNGVFIKVPGFQDLDSFELNVYRVGVFEVLNFHGLKDRSKKALWTVAPSERSMTLK